MFSKFSMNYFTIIINYIDITYSRVCDIDIIDYNGEIIHRKLGKHILNIPHKRMHNRNFVLFPLYEIDKDWVHPKLNKNIVILMSNLASDQLLGVKIAQ